LADDLVRKPVLRYREIAFWGRPDLNRNPDSFAETKIQDLSR